MLTLPQLYQRTTSDRKQRSIYVRLLKVKAGYTKEGLGFIACQSYSRYKIDQSGKPVRNVKPNKYVTIIMFLDKSLHVKVSCSCEDNMFMYEVANHYKDAADIEYSNGDAPNIKNPKHNPGMCKHLIALFEHIKPKLVSKR
jgi:hypothetical protein